MLPFAAAPNPEIVEAGQRTVLAIAARTFASHRPLKPMLDHDRLEWCELQVLAAQERIRAVQMAKHGDSEQLRELLGLLIGADHNLVCRATEWGLSLVANHTTVEERRAIVLAQDSLNGLDQIAEMLAAYGARAALDGE